MPLNVEPEIEKEIATLRNNPLPDGTRIRKVVRVKPILYRLKVRSYRVLFRIENNTVIIIAVIHRRELEKELRNL